MSATQGPGASAPPALEVVNLSHVFKNRPALSSLSFAVPDGSLHGFVGSNGAGKTTTLKIAATLLAVQSGVVRVCGYDVRRERQEVRARIGFMPDHFSSYRTMRVDEYLDFFGAAYGLSQSRRRAVVDGVLALTDMEARRADRIQGLSRGMQQRLSLARVLINDPQLLLLDEPASGLDPRARIELMEVLRELRAMGKTIFISSHILSELADLCDSVTLIDRGRLKYSGSMRELLSHGADTAIYRLRLAGPLDGHEATLRGLVGVEEVEVSGDGAGEVRVRFQRAVLLPQELLAALVRAGAPVIAFNEDLRHLNQVFLDLTEPGVRE